MILKRPWNQTQPSAVRNGLEFVVLLLIFC